MIQKYIAKIVALLAIIPLLASCGEDRRHEVDQRQDTQRWIYDTMSNDYYWYEDIPQEKELNFFDEPTIFFKKLLSKKDGNGSMKFSYIHKINPTLETRTMIETNNSYGLEFSAIVRNDNKFTGQCIVLYTLPGSPAEQAGLKRGDIITHINGEKLIENQIFGYGNGSLLLGPEIILTINNYLEPTRKITLPASTMVNNDPLLICKKLEGYKNLGYILYNHFTYGTPEEEENNKIGYHEGSYLKNMIEQTKKLQGIEDLILDLRYNSGGELNTAGVLTSIICPTHSIEEHLGYLEFNDLRAKENTKMPTAQSYLSKTAGVNLNIKNLYVITGQSTASASEFVINALKPFMNVHVIGTKTIGKNVGSQGYNKGNWHIQPIVLKIFNSLHESDYSEGFTPGLYNANSAQNNKENLSLYNIAENIPFKELGTPNEPLLNRVLFIRGHNNSRAHTRGLDSAFNTSNYKLGESSISVRKTNDLIYKPLND